MPSSRMLGSAPSDRTEVSEEPTTIIITVTKIAKLGTMLAVNGNRITLPGYCGYC
jgi:hypothetical protein